MDYGFNSVKGLFGYKLSDKPSKEITGKIYKFTATPNGISVYRNGELVADEIEHISYNEDSRFCIGLKNGRKICFDAVNQREFGVIHCSDWRPEYIITTEGDFYPIRNDIIFATPTPEKVVIENGKVDINGGLHLVESGNGNISLANRDGVVVLKDFTTDRNAKFNYTSPSYGSARKAFYTVKESDKTKLIDASSEEVFFETSRENTVVHDDIETGKTYAILDQYPERKLTVVHVFDKKGKELQTVEVPGYAKYVTYEKDAKFLYIGYMTKESNDMFYIDFDGNDVTKTIKDLAVKRNREFEVQLAKERAEREAARIREHNERARNRENANMLMGASLMGLGMPSTGATVMAVTAIQRHKRKMAEDNNNSKETNNSANEYGDD